MPATQTTSRGDLYAVTAAMLFGVSGAVAADAFATFTPIQIAQSRSVLAALVLGVLAIHRGMTSTAGRLHELGLLGAFLALVTIMYYWTIERLGVGPGVTVQFLGPTMVLVWMRFVQRRSVPGLAWVAAGTAVFGTALVTRAWEYQTLDAVGVMFGLGAAITFAGYLIMGERLGKRLPGLTIGAYGFAISALLLLLLAPVEIPQAALGGWMQLGWIALGGTVAPFMLALAALRLTDPGRVGVLSTMEPPVAAVAAWLLLGQVLSGIQMVGGLVVIASVATVQHVTSSVAPDAPSPQAI